MDNQAKYPRAAAVTADEMRLTCPKISLRDVLIKTMLRTWLLDRRSIPLTVLISASFGTGIVSIRMRLVVSENCVRWRVAPSSESSYNAESVNACHSGVRWVMRTREPMPPATAPHARSSSSRSPVCSRQTAFSTESVAHIVQPIAIPPPMDALVPSHDNAPLVPGGTKRKVVRRIGGVVERMPSSDASVSPRQQPKCLRCMGIRAHARGGRLPEDDEEERAAPAV